MLELLIVLTPIALVDCLSVVPTAIIPLAVLLGAKRPLSGSLSFIAGIVLTYLPFGVLLLFGLDAVFEELAERFVALWTKEPDLADLVLQILIGLALVAFGYRISIAREKKAKQKTQPGMTPWQGFVIAVLVNVTGMWGALPYFAAIAQILKADLTATSMVIALCYYNLVFVLPLLAFVMLRLHLGSRADRWFQAVTAFFSHWGRRLLVAVLIGLGLILIIDGVGWLLGKPLIPIA